MKVAVVGANGFIGRHVVKQLLQQNIETVAVIRKSPHPQIQLGKSIQFVELDVNHATSDTYEILGKPDALIHLAWGGLPFYQSPLHIEKELPSHYQFLNNLVRSGLSTLFVAGTCYEYGNQIGQLDEEDSPAPNNSYAIAKNALRVQLELLKSSVPFSFIWGRLFYLYGEGQAPTSLYPLVRQAIAEGRTEFALTSGDQLRDYLAVDAAAKFIVDLTLRGRDVGIVNICSGRPISIRDLVNGWIRDNGWTLNLTDSKQEQRAFETQAFWGDNSKLKSLIGIKP